MKWKTNIDSLTLSLSLTSVKLRSPLSSAPLQNLPSIPPPHRDFPLCHVKFTLWPGHVIGSPRCLPRHGLFLYPLGRGGGSTCSCDWCARSIWLGHSLIWVSFFIPRHSLWNNQIFEVFWGCNFGSWRRLVNLAFEMILSIPCSGVMVIELIHKCCVCGVGLFGIFRILVEVK